jgi:hypothetical protein
MSANYDFVRISDQNGQVLVTSGAIERFADRWPCSGMRGLDAGVIFSYASNGDLVHIQWFSAESGAEIEWPNGLDGTALLALSHDSQIVAFDPFHDAVPCHVEAGDSLQAAREAIEREDDVCFDVAADHGQIFANVKHMTWFVEAVATEL